MPQDPLYLLCVEPRFPGRLGAVADWLVRRRGYRCRFLCADADPRDFWPASVWRGMEVIRCPVPGEAAVGWTRVLDRSLAHARAYFDHLDATRPRPIDLVLGRSAGLGSTQLHPLLEGWLQKLEPYRTDLAGFQGYWAEWDRYRAEMAAFLAGYDAILCPVYTEAALPHGASIEEANFRGFSHTMAYNVAGLPGAVLRCGETRSGLPIAVQVVARAWREYGVTPWRCETLEFSTDQELVAKVAAARFLAEASALVDACQRPELKKDALRRWKAREMLRIGIRDLAGLADMPSTAREFSNLAAACVQLPRPP